MTVRLESWDTMTQLEHPRRKATALVVAVLVGLIVVGFLVVKLWPDSGSPSKGGVAKGPDLTWQAAADGVSLPVSRSAGPGQALSRWPRHRLRRLGARCRTGRNSHLSQRICWTWSSCVHGRYSGPAHRRRPGCHTRHITKEYGADRQKFGLPEGAPIPPSGAGRIAYKVSHYTTAQTATITIASSLADDATKYFAFDLEVRWIDGDWQMVAPPAGSFASVFRELPELPQDFVVLKADR